MPGCPFPLGTIAHSLQRLRVLPRDLAEVLPDRPVLPVLPCALLGRRLLPLLRVLAEADWLTAAPGFLLRSSPSIGVICCTVDISFWILPTVASMPSIPPIRLTKPWSSPSICPALPPPNKPPLPPPPWLTGAAGC